MSEYSNNFSLTVNIKFARDVVLKSYSPPPPPFPSYLLYLNSAKYFPFNYILVIWINIQIIGNNDIILIKYYYEILKKVKL